MTFVLTAFAATLTEELNVNVRGIGYLPKMEVAAQTQERKRAMIRIGIKEIMNGCNSFYILLVSALFLTLSNIFYP